MTRSPAASSGKSRNSGTDDSSVRPSSALNAFLYLKFFFTLIVAPFGVTRVPWGFVVVTSAVVPSSATAARSYIN